MDQQLFLTTSGFGSDASSEVRVIPNNPLRAVDLSGSIDRLTNAGSAFEMAGTDFTIVGWFKFPTSTTTADSLVTYGSASTAANFNYQILVATTSNVRFLLSNGTSVFQADSNTSLLGTDWHFFAATFDDTSKVLSMSLDDGAAGTDTLTGSVPSLSSVTFTIGSSAGFTINNAENYTSCVGIWQRVLTGAEITSLFNSGIAKRWDGLTAGEQTTAQEYFNLDEISAGSSPVTRENSVSIRDLTDVSNSPSIEDVPS